jgi:hypothetical protein
LVVPVIAVVAFVFAATGHAAVLGVADGDTGTVMVQLVAGLTIWRPATVMVLVPPVAVTVPPEHVPPTAPAPITRPEGSVSVNENAWVGLPAGCVTVKVSVEGVPPIVTVVGANAFVSAGVAAVTVKHWSTTLFVRFVVPVIAVVAFVFAATGHAVVVGAAACVTGTVIVQEVAGLTTWRLATVIVVVPAVAVTVPPEHVPPTAPAATTRPAGKVSVKLNVCVGLLAGCVTVKVSVEGAPPTVIDVGANAFVSAGVAALTVTQAPVVLVPPPAAEFWIAEVTFVTAEIAAFPFVFAATGHVPDVGVADTVTGTVIVQEAALTWRLATVIVFVPAVAVTVPPVHEPPTAPAPTTRPAGSVSVKLKVCAGLVAGCETVNVSVVGPPPMVSAPAKALSSVGTAVTVTQAPVVLVPPPAAEFPMAAVRFVIAEIAALPLVFAATGQVPAEGVADAAIGTVIVQEAPATWRPATVIVPEPVVAVTVPPAQVPPTAPVPTARPAGSVSVKLNVCVGFVAGCVTVNVRVTGAPPIVRPPENALSSDGVAAFTVTHAPVVLVPPPAAEFAIAAVRFVVAEIAALPLVFAAAGHVLAVGVADTVTGTVIVQEVAGLTTWRPATLIVLEPAVAVTVPPVHVPPTAPAATARPAGSVSVKLNACVGLFAGCETVNVSVVEPPPIVSAPPKALFSDGVAAVTVRHWSTTLLVRLVVPVIAVVALVFAATGQAAVLGVAEFVTGTVIVQDAPLTWRAATVMVLVPAVAVTVPLVHVPPTPPAAIVRPAGNVSVKEKVCVGLLAGCVTVNVSVDGAPPIVIVVGANAFVRAGVAAVTVKH